MKHWMKRAVALAALSLAQPAVAIDGKPRLESLDVFPVAVTAERLVNFKKGDGTQRRFDKLTFRGGLVLKAPDTAAFGGWSGLVLDAEAKRFLAVSDNGAWMRGRIDYRDGAPSGIADATMGPMRTFDGRPLRRSRDRDAEDVALVSGSPDAGVVQVAFERNARVAVYKVSSRGFSPTQRLLEKPRETAQMKRNSGFEAMTVIRGGRWRGRTVLLAEELLDDAKNHTGWIYTREGPQRFAVTERDSYQITGVASLDDGTLFLLERRFRWLDGVRMRIRRIAADAVRPGAVIEGDTLLEAGMLYEVDNMEAIAATRLKNGKVMLTLLSDDNFNSALQRNLLLQFEVD